MGIATPQLLSQIRHPESSFARLAALRSLKNEIVGHDQRKEAWIESGVIPALSQVLAGRREDKDNGESDPEAAKLRAHFSTSYHRTPDIRTGDDAACLQAAIVVGTLAQGGPAYTSPILAGDLVPSLLAVLSSATRPQSLAVAILQTLNAIADKIPSGHGIFDAQGKHLSSLLFSKDRVSWLGRILDQTSGAPNVQLSIDLAADLIAKLCAEEQHKVALAEVGVLDILAIRLASFVVAQGFVLPGAETYLNTPGALGSMPPPAPDNASLTSVLRAIAVLVEHSKTRAEHFVTSPGIVTVFPKRIPQFRSGDTRKSPWAVSSFTGHPGSRQRPSNPIDSLLPSIPVPPSQGSVNFPPLGSGSSQSKHGIFNESLPFFGAPAAVEDESALVSWLFHVARTEVGLTRVIAARLITTLFRLGLAKKQRVSMMAYLLVPLLLRMLDKDFEVPGDTDTDSKDALSPTLRVREEAPAVLASLVMDDRELQKNAADGGAIKKLAHLLKGTFNGASGVEKPMWSPSKEQPAGADSASAELGLGPHGFPPLVVHKMRVREGVLKALAALSLFKEEYRKDICDNGLVPYIIDSMKPCDSETAASVSESKKECLDLNPIPTLLAACYAAKSLTRSVSVLRTSLIDAGVATPIFTLAKFRDIDVQIAATQVICNLAMDFSPMKESVIGGNMIPTLCEHAHSSNTKLRIECLWALKHIAYNSSNDIKMKIIEQLEPGWIKQIISQDTASSSPTAKKNGNGIARTPSVEMTMSTSTPAGERDDLLGSSNGAPVQDPETEDPDQRMTEDAAPSNPSADTLSPENARRRKLMLNDDLDHTKQARKDDIQVQEQTFDLLRNLICGTGASEMIDYLFRELGRNDLLEILADKLRPRTLPPFGRRDSGSSKTVTSPSEILCSVTYILIHLAAGLSRHRQQLTIHPELLRLLVPHFNHSSKQIRVNCVWIVINLTFKDDQSDDRTCFERALKLKSLGLMEKLSSLEDDSETDVRERTKTALATMNSLLGS